MVCEEVVQQIRIERIKQAKEEEGWIAYLKNFLVGSVTQMSDEDAKMCSWIAPDSEVDDNGLLFFCPRASRPSEDRIEVILLVVPELLHRFSASFFTRV